MRLSLVPVGNGRVIIAPFVRMAVLDGDPNRVQACLTAGAVLRLAADTPAVRYLLAHLAEVAE